MESQVSKSARPFDKLRAGSGAAGRLGLRDGRFCFLPALDPHFVPIKKSSLTKARPAEGIFFWMRSARHDKGYATSGIAAHPFDHAQGRLLQKTQGWGNHLSLWEKKNRA